MRTITRPRFTARRSSQPRPQRSIVPGRKFSASTSAAAARRLSSARPPPPPLVGKVTDRDLAAVADERRAQEPRLRQRALEQALGRVERDAQPHRLVGRALLVDDGGRPEAVGESLQLALRGGAFLQIDEVHTDAALGEEAQRPARVLAVVEAEDLDVHAARAFSAAAFNSSQTLMGTRGWPRRLVRPLRSP